MRPRFLGTVRSRIVAVPLALTALLAVAVPARAFVGHDDHGTHTGHAGHGDHAMTLPPVAVARLRASTARYHRVDAALGSGRVDLHLCFDQMGEHYADPATFADGVLDPIDPEALVYAHVGDKLRLVAVEWVSTTPGTVLGMPLHLNEALGVYVLHAWIWDTNPDGMLADRNPDVGDCPA